MTTEPTSAYSAKLDAGFPTVLLSIESILVPSTGFRLDRKCFNARRDIARFREDVSCPPLVA
jgi:hypothetical protein